MTGCARRRCPAATHPATSTRARRHTTPWCHRSDAVSTRDAAAVAGSARDGTGGTASRPAARDQRAQRPGHGERRLGQHQRRERHVVGRRRQQAADQSSTVTRTVVVDEQVERVQVAVADDLGRRRRRVGRRSQRGRCDQIGCGRAASAPARSDVEHRRPVPRSTRRRPSSSRARTGVGIESMQRGHDRGQRVGSRRASDGSPATAPTPSEPGQQRCARRPGPSP